VYIASTSIVTLLADISVDLLSIAKWLAHNRLLINWLKTQAILIKSHFLSIPNNNLIKITVDGVNIPFSTHVKLLGVVIDNKLNFDLHSISVCKKINNKIHLLKKSAYLLTPSLKIILFKLFIVPCFSYCSSLFFHFNVKTDFKRLEICFKNSLRHYLGIKISGLTIQEQYNLLVRIGLLPLRILYIYRFLTFIFTIIRNNCKLKNFIFGFLINSSTLRQPFVLPKFKTNVKKYSLTSFSIKYLNLFVYQKLNLSKNKFKSYLTTSIFSIYSDSAKFWQKST
jgi:hypothetical protein